MSNKASEVKKKKSRQLSLGWRLGLATLGACVTVAVFVGYVADRSKADSIESLAQYRVETAAKAADKRLGDFASAMEASLSLIATTNLGREPMRDFASAWEAMSGEGPAGKLRQAYIDSNPQPAGERHLLDNAGDGSTYSDAHAKYHPVFRKILTERGYYDIFMISPEGEIVYTVFKEDDFATSLTSGDYAESALGDVFRRARETGQTAWSGIARYAPSANAPAAFIAHPIFAENGSLVGVAAIQVNTSQLAYAISGIDNTQPDGIRAFLVGSDGLLRSDVAGTPEDETLKATYGSELLGAVTASQGAQGITSGLTGAEAYAAIEAANWGDRNWMLVAEWDRDLYLAPLAAQRVSLLITVLPVLAIILVLSLLGTRTISRAIRNMATTVEDIAAGEDHAVPGLQRGDELGVLARSLELIRSRAQDDRRLRVSLDRSPSMMVIADDAFKVTYVSDQFRGFLSQHPEWIKGGNQKSGNTEAGQSPLVGQSLESLFSDPAVMRKALTGKDASFTGKVAVGKLLIELVTSPVKDQGGKIIGYLTIAKDVTEQVQIEEQIEKLVKGVSSGDLSNRITIESHEPFVKRLVTGLNETGEIISGFLGELQTTMAAMAAGDTTRRMSTDHQGAFLEVAEATNATTKRIGELVGKIKAASHEIETTVSTINSGANDLSARAESQASSLEETAATMEELAASVRSNATNVASVDRMAAESRSAAETGQDVVSRAVEAMEQIQGSSAKVSEFVTVIDSIAFQTNLLALNAAVEAARAGEAGKGFAVVASEVRTLAQRSAEAAQDIKELIQLSGTEVEAGVDLVKSTGSALEDIASRIARVAETAQQITQAGREQATGIEEIAAAISKLDEITQQNSSLADQSASSAASLSSQIGILTGLTRDFRVQGGMNDQPAKLQERAPSAARPAPKPKSALGSAARPLPKVSEDKLDAKFSEFAGKPADPKGKSAQVKTAPPVAATGTTDAAPMPQQRSTISDDDDWAEF